MNAEFRELETRQYEKSTAHLVSEHGTMYVILVQPDGSVGRYRVDPGDPWGDFERMLDLARPPDRDLEP
jgi:hypothetical protein